MSSVERNTDPEMTEQLSKEALQERIAMFQSVHRKMGSDWAEAQKDTDKMIAENVVLTETGAFGPWYKEDFQFDQAGRDRLLAHGRQDSARALITSLNVFDIAVEALSLAARTHRLLIASLALNILVLLTLWLR